MDKNQDTKPQLNLSLTNEESTADEIRERKIARRKTWIRLIVLFILTGCFTLTIALMRGWGATTKETYINITDSFTVPSVMLFMIWAILKVSDEGAFDALGFIGGNVFRSLIPFGRNKMERETYAEYKERKKASRKKEEPIGWSISRCMLIVATLYFLVSLVFLFLWYRA